MEWIHRIVYMGFKSMQVKYVRLLDLKLYKHKT